MKKVLLCILDGVGISSEVVGNAVYNAKTPILDKLLKNYPNSKLEASGELVGLPLGQMGNSEVGHMNIGAGRIVYQPLGLINSKIKDGSFYENIELLSVVEHVKKNNSKLHIMGLLSDGGIHSHINHIFAILELCKKNNIDNIYLHMFLDGRDTSPYSGEKYIRMLEGKLEELGVGVIASISGRYYAMDRDNNYDRIKLSYDVIVNAKGPKYNSAISVWEDNQRESITDEFVVPAIIDVSGIVESNDGIIFANFRPDRLRELGACLTNKEFKEFETKNLDNIKLVTMMPVSDEVKCSNAFRIEDLVNTLGEYVSGLGVSQLRIAETEKYAHVTYFFDGGKEKDLINCKRILIPSPKVETYDLKPEMSAYEITDTLISELNNEKPDLVVLNFANGDMVGHTGNYEAAIKAVETLDKCLDKLISKVDRNEYTIIITADHGNCEVMINNDGSINTQHTTNLVPFIVMDKNISLASGKLGDIASTILEIMELDVPPEMTGRSLVVRK